jgi:hypothetical protein
METVVWTKTTGAMKSGCWTKPDFPRAGTEGTVVGDYFSETASAFDRLGGPERNGQDPRWSEAAVRSLAKDWLQSLPDLLLGLKDLSPWPIGVDIGQFVGLDWLPVAQENTRHFAPRHGPD